MLLVVEVADTSLEYNRAKPSIHATAGIREVWIVDLDGARIEVSRGPAAASYRETQALSRGERLACETFPDVVVGVDAILG